MHLASLPAVFITGDYERIVPQTHLTKYTNAATLRDVAGWI